MTRFEKFIPIIFKNEGILSDNVNDAGGLTKYGISQRAYPNLDIRNLTKQQAEEIYKRDYYDVCKIDLIENELLALHVFDMAVNAGVGRSIRMLQRVILVDVDGVIGTQTINTANAANWAAAFIQARINYYKQIATGRNLGFLDGWLYRVQNTTKSL
jgi:lysozyme family protein